MKGFHIVVLLSSAVLLVSAAPALELVTCSKESGAAAARLTMHRINENHGHGYKFRLQEIQGNKVETVDGGCNLELQLNLLETVCHVINPKHFEDCEIREEAERAVMANCTIKMSVRNTDANVTKYECDTRQVKTNLEMVTICPDCPTLDPLNSTEGLKSVNEAVSKFNQNTTNQHYYILKEVGRITVGYIPSVGMAYYAEFALVETHCPMGSRINPEACKPLCPDRAVYITLSPSSTSLFCTMKGFHIVVLLSSAVLLVSAAPALELVTCSKESGAAAARLTMHRINENHGHGYKFRLQEIQGNKVETVDGGCNLELQLNLLETVCHVINPKHFEDCEIREEAERAVMANCTIKMSVRNTDANVTKYECDTRQVKTNLEMVTICPDCPTLDPLNSTEGLKSVNEAVSKFNQNTTNQHYYILKEVGRITVGYIPSVGMAYYAEFALVETHCPMGSRINPEACKPLCPDRAHHAFCKSTYFESTGLQSVECEFYPPSNTTALGPGQQEPVCRHHVGGHPPHVGAGRPPLGPRDGDGHPPHVGAGRPLLGCILPPLGGDGPPPSGGDGQPSRPCGPRPHGGDGHPPRVGGSHGGPPPHGGDGHGGRHHAGDGHGDQEKQHHRPPFGSKHHFHGFHHCRGSDPALHPICPWPRPWHRPSPRDKD